MASEVRQLDLVLKLQDQASKQLRNFSGELGMMEKAGNAAKTAIISMGAGLVGLGVFAVKSAADMEKMRVSLSTSFKGNEEEAKKAFDTINEFTAKTPFQLEEVMTGFIKLKNMGLDPSKKALTSYGDTASAMGKSLNQMVEAVADAATGEFERLKEFGIKTKSEGDKVTFTFRGVSKTVGKNAKEIEDYLIKLGETEFAGGMEAQSKTLYGVLSTLKDQVSLTMASVAEESGALDIVKKLVNDLASAIEKNKEKVISWIKNWVASMGGKEGIQQKMTDFYMVLKNEVIPTIMTVLGVIKDVTFFIWEHRVALMVIIGLWEALKVAIAITSVMNTTKTAIGLLSTSLGTTGLSGTVAALTSTFLPGLVLAFAAVAAVLTVKAIGSVWDMWSAMESLGKSTDENRRKNDELQARIDTMDSGPLRDQLQLLHDEQDTALDDAKKLEERYSGLLGVWNAIVDEAPNIIASLLGISEAKAGNESDQKKAKESWKNTLSGGSNSNPLGAFQGKSVNDAIIAPNGNIITTDPKDYLIATKKPGELSGGGGGGVNVVINYPFVLDRNGGDMLADVISNSLRNKLRI